MAEKFKKKPVLYKAELTNLKTRQRIVKPVYTYAYSIKQAQRNFGITNPGCLIDKVTDTVTGIAFTRQQWIEATKHQRDN